MSRSFGGAVRVDHGFTLIEVLVVAIVVGVLAAVAGPVLLHQRSRAQVVATKAALRDAATSAEAYAARDIGALPAGAEGVAVLLAEGYHPHADVTLSVVDGDMAGAGGGYCLRAVHRVLGASRAWYLAGSGPRAGTPTREACEAS